AKALNCQNRSEEMEPCNVCSSCKEITAGHSLDVLEIDGASHRGIEDVRQINDTAGYSASSGGYKIYIIDEVHMLTKEAFNALLKTLEEPPPKVKFFFATTEPHKVLPTIISRCQRFHLNRIPDETIVAKLRAIAQDLQIDAAEEALRMVAEMSDGGLRDAESLFDQLIAFHDGKIDAAVVGSVLGATPSETFFELDEAAKNGDLSCAFTLVDRVWAEGKDLSHFLESLTNHFRTLLLIHTAGPDAPQLFLTVAEKKRYLDSCKIYTADQCLQAVEMLLKCAQEIRTSTSAKFTLEALLMRLIRLQKRISLESMVDRLEALEKRGPAVLPPPPPPKKEVPTVKATVNEDPTPKPEEVPKPAPKKAAPAPAKKPVKAPDQKAQTRYDTLMQFAAVELEGTVERK
ncbi:MAG: DNA polymerase III subunit gamma/tau, partial [Chlamydiia bacterium]|nr:DNA polymerase III subunit gamma/tau [Chlamydiia bacterium]